MKEVTPKYALSMSDFAKDIKSNIQIFGPGSLTDEGKVMPFEEQMAIITHYLSTKDNGYARSYEIAAKELIKDVLDFKYGAREEFANAAESPLEYNLFSELEDVPFKTPKNPKFTFIDLFAGIGGFRIAMQNQGGQCIYSSEFNTYAQRTYLANFGDLPFGDITKEETKKFIPDNFDILCAGFPCQPFSIAGVSKKKSLGRETGFLDKTQGTLFFEVADIIRRHRPKAFYLENVKNLLSHDKGNTFKVIKSTLEELNYTVYYRVMDGQAFVPQHRERIMIVGYDKKVYRGKEVFKFPELKQSKLRVGDILETNIDKKYTLTDNLWNYLQHYAERQKAKGNGFGYGLVDLEGITRTLSARYYKDGSEILIPQSNGSNPRRLTPRECTRLMGYPDQYIINKVSDMQAYKQCGNSVIVPLITAVSEEVVRAMLNKNQ